MNLVIKSLVGAVPDNRSVGMGKGMGEIVHFRVFHSQHVLFLNLPLKIKMTDVINNRIIFSNLRILCRKYLREHVFLHGHGHYEKIRSIYMTF